MSADTQNQIEISEDEYYAILTKYYKGLDKPSKIEVEKNIQYNIENGIMAGQEKPRGLNKIPKKKKRKR